ncbi:hypothetical protein ACFOLJ_30400 [Rugamonas sp. CCM 8940]|uniref:hypothetical protein n=1 Tax=Rugamonas sp. CCM 8940 TaxID=2765359 RepID=UPI0018F34F83|nr:hypothetical protein [Rugamonas sp. CCM 8940]MBJ7313136.1 hypothetical protein [Rugamonas sp. CCM 8940]
MKPNQSDQQADAPQPAQLTDKPNSLAATPARLERRHVPPVPPAPERIREQLGWWLIPANKRGGA